MASLLFLSKVGLSLWVGVYTLLGGLTILATETAAGHDKLEEDSWMWTSRSKEDHTKCKFLLEWVSR